MKKKAIIYDLDNTLFPVPSIGEELFKPVFDLIAASGDHYADMDAIKQDMMRIPFRVVAEQFDFSKELSEKAIAIMEDIEYNKPIETFEDYSIIKQLPGERFLVTTGFRKMQASKVKSMGIAEDFTEFHIVDPTITSKKEVFAGIMQRYNYRPEEVLVVGDDPDSELKAARELGIDTVLYRPMEGVNTSGTTYCINNYSELKDILCEK
jgi:putative hydrolase of the HAD superfamily